MIFLVMLLASGISDGDANAAIIYIQSYSTPALFEVCKSAMPARANEFDTALAGWRKANSAVVAQGEAIVRAQAAQDGSDVEAMFSAQRDSMVAQLRALSKREQGEHCDHFLDVTRSEQ